MQSLFARFCGNEYPITATFMPYTRFNIRKCFLLWNYFPSDSDETEKYGIYHATNEGGYISWYDFACEIFRLAEYSTTVQPVSTEEYGLSKAHRPKNSRLDKSKLAASGFLPLPDWKDALKRYYRSLY